ELMPAFGAIRRHMEEVLPRGEHLGGGRWLWIAGPRERDEICAIGWREIALTRPCDRQPAVVLLSGVHAVGRGGEPERRERQRRLLDERAIVCANGSVVIATTIRRPAGEVRAQCNRRRRLGWRHVRRPLAALLENQPSDDAVGERDETVGRTPYIRLRFHAP